MFQACTIILVVVWCFCFIFAHKPPSTRFIIDFFPLDIMIKSTLWILIPSTSKYEISSKMPAMYGPTVSSLSRRQYIFKIDVHGGVVWFLLSFCHYMLFQVYPISYVGKINDYKSEIYQIMRKK